MQAITQRDGARNDQAQGLEDLVQVEQFDFAARLAPLTVVLALVAVQVAVVLFWAPNGRAYFLWLDAYCVLMAGVALVSAARWRNGQKPERLEPRTLRITTVVALGAGLALASIPIVLFGEATAQERALILAMCAGLIGTGMSLAVLPRVALAFSGPIVVATAVVLAATGDVFYLAVGLLLILYAAFLWFLAQQLSALIRNRVVDRINLERERGLTGMLLKEFEDNANDWLWEADHELRLLHLSDRIADVSGIPQEGWKGDRLTSVLERVVAPDSWPTLDRLREQIEARQAFRDLQLHVNIYGRDRWWLISGKPTYVGANRFSGYRGVGADITDKKRAEDRISHLALHDALTDLPNRVYFQKKLDAAVESNAPFAVLCLDLDEFKDINDAFGHGVGDDLLRLAGRRLQARMGPQDCVARLAGDEFTILLRGEEANNRESLTAYALSIIAELGEPYALEGMQAHVGVSVGVAMSPEHGAQELMRRADLALYQSKREGKNGLAFYQSDMDKQIDARRALAADLRTAMDNHEFLLHFQPLVNAATKEIQGFEALLRWRHPTRGFVSPGEFISLAEETGVIVPLGEWTLREACRIAASWPLPLKIAVNLSPIQFRYADLPTLVSSALEESGLAPHRLELELTESAFLEATQLTQATLEKLRALGVRMSLDDFGTGYSSLSYLRRIPFDKIKIDRCFVQDLPGDTRDLSIVRAVVDIATAMGMAITAEGVETDEQSRCLLQHGCHQLQGYFFSRPVPAEDVVAMMRARAEPADEAA